MSIELNKVILQGRISQDPKIEALPSGTCKATFNIASTRKWKNKQTGQTEESTSFNRCVTFGGSAELIANYTFKGKEIYVEGYLETRSWGDGQQKQWITEVVVEEIKLGADPKGSNVAGRGSNQQVSQQQSGYQHGQQQQNGFDPGF